MKKVLFVIMLTTTTISLFIPCVADEVIGENSFCGLPVYPGSEKVVRTESADTGMAIYRNRGSIDINYNYYESYLLAGGWEKPRISEEVSNSMDLPIIIMVKENRQWYICFYTDSDNFTCAVLVAGKE